MQKIQELLEQGLSKETLTQALDAYFQKERAPHVAQNYAKGMQIKQLAKSLPQAKKYVEQRKANLVTDLPSYGSPNKAREKAEKALIEERQFIDDLDYQLRLYQSEEKAREAAGQLPKAMQESAGDYIAAKVAANEVRASSYAINRRLNDILNRIVAMPTTYFPDQALEDLKIAKKDISGKLKEAEQHEEQARLAFRKAYASFAGPHLEKLQKALAQAQESVNEYDSLAQTANAMHSNSKVSVSFIEQGQKHMANLLRRVGELGHEQMIIREG